MRPLMWMLSLCMAGAACSAGGVPTGGVGASQAASPINTPSSPGAALPNTPASPTPPPTNPPVSQTANPFMDATLYVSPDWTMRLNSTLATATAADQALLQKIAMQPVAIWLDSIGAVQGGAANNGRLSLTGHLDAAVQQAQTSGRPATLVLVVYNLPNRDCSAGASAGKLMGDAGLQSYQKEYIDPIVAALATPTYSNLRVVLVLEPDSMPNMVTNLMVPACATVAMSSYYEKGLTYAIGKFAALPNTTLYLDIAQSAWLGWPNNMEKAVPLYAKLINDATNNNASRVRGFVTNISNYVPLQEPFLSPTDPAVLASAFYQNNPIFDELTYARTLQQSFAAAGLPNMHFIVDTSRNGWPAVQDGKPIVRRSQRGHWCNIAAAGLGERPQAAPAAWDGYDAYFWIKTPGESDGASTDPSCDPANPDLGAFANAPAAGMWFPEGLLSMARQATPPL